MAKFKFSINNGHYKAGTTAEISDLKAKAFAKLKWGEVVIEEKPKYKKSSKK